MFQHNVNNLTSKTPLESVPEWNDAEIMLEVSALVNSKHSSVKWFVCIGYAWDKRFECTTCILKVSGFFASSMTWLVGLCCSCSTLLSFNFFLFFNFQHNVNNLTSKALVKSASGESGAKSMHEISILVSPKHSWGKCFICPRHALGKSFICKMFHVIFELMLLMLYSS